MKSQPLRNLVVWLEQVHGHGGPCGAKFELHSPSILVMKTEAMLAWTIATGRPVDVFTGSLSAEAVLAALVLRRSGVSIQRVYHGLEEEDFERLTRCLGEIRRSGFELIEGSPPAGLRNAGFLGGRPLLAVVAPEDAVESLVRHSAPEVPALG